MICTSATGPMDPRIWRKLGGGFLRKSLSFNMAHLAMVETGIYILLTTNRCCRAYSVINGVVDPTSRAYSLSALETRPVVPVDTSIVESSRVGLLF